MGGCEEEEEGVRTCALGGLDKALSQDLSDPGRDLHHPLPPHYGHHQVGGGKPPVMGQQVVDDGGGRVI